MGHDDNVLVYFVLGLTVAGLCAAIVIASIGTKLAATAACP